MTNIQWYDGGGEREKPVIVLAFANDRLNGKRYLEKLPEELKGIQNALRKAEYSGICEVVILTAATPVEIANTFQHYKDRIAVFHFGGHAASYKLLLETAGGAPMPVYQKGLVSFFSKQQGLKLVFLNGCSTLDHAVALTNAGVPAAAGTSHNVLDWIAVDLSVRFYNGIAEGYSIERAWKEARDFVDMQFSKEAPEASKPWHIRYKNASARVESWTLPDAAGDPLYGLPALTETVKLPASPFLLLKPYREEHAELFFGRSRYIRDLYNRLTLRRGSPIILLYGQTGSGKSSLLQAGLIPRLKQTGAYTVISIHNAEPDGLCAALKNSLLEKLTQLGKSTPVEPDTQWETGLESGTLETAELWRLLEKQTGLPLLVMLDQVEEIRGSAGGREQLDDLLKHLAPLFTNADDYPEGKLLLGYRSDFHPLMEERFKDAELDCKTLFLPPLKGDEITEVVTGLTRTRRLREKYNLRVEASLPGAIAHQLTAQPGSPVAPTLQILLTRMWEDAELEARSHLRLFTLERFNRLEQGGLMMTDFFHRQMTKMHNDEPDAVDSGLVLDILLFHIAPSGVSISRRTDEILETYRHRRDTVSRLLLRLKAVYLLTEYRLDNAPRSRLIHDTLIPVVLDESHESDSPGRRASRILAAKMENRAGGTRRFLLNRSELDAVRLGRGGMRTLNDDEELLVTQSIRHKRTRDAITSAVTILVIGLLVTLFVLHTQNRYNKKVTAITRANHLAAQAQLLERPDPSEALAVAAAAMEKHKSTLVRRTIHQLYRENNFYKIIQHPKIRLTSETVSPDGRFILGSMADNTAGLWDWRGNKLALLTGHRDKILSAAFSPLGNHILTGSSDQTAGLWDMTGKRLLEMKHTAPVSAAAFTADGTGILTGTTAGDVWLRDFKGNLMGRMTLPGRQIKWLASSPDGQDLFIGTTRTIYCGNVPTKTDPKIGLPPKMSPKIIIQGQSRLHAAALSPDGRFIATVFAGQPATLRRSTGEQLGTFDVNGHHKQTASLAFSADGHYLLTGSADQTARLWRIDGHLLQVFHGHTDDVTAVGFAENQQFIVTGSADNRIRLWMLKDNARMIMEPRNGPVRAAAFLPESDQLITASQKGILHVWNRNGNAGRQIIDFKQKLTAAAVSPDGRFTAAGLGNGTLALINHKGQPLWSFPAHRSEITSVAFSSDGRLLLTASNDKSARLWNVQKEEVAALMAHTRRVNRALFSTDGQSILTASNDGTARLWDFKGNVRRVFQLPPNQWVTATAFSPDGNYILTGSARGEIQMWNRAGDTVKQFIGHNRMIKDLCFSPDGTLILSASMDDTARLWNRDGYQLQIFKGHLGGVLNATFSPDGRTLLTGGRDSARLWKPLPVDKFLQANAVDLLTPDQLKQYENSEPLR